MIMIYKYLQQWQALLPGCPHGRAELDLEAALTGGLGHSIVLGLHHGAVHTSATHQSMLATLSACLHACLSWCTACLTDDMLPTT